MSDPTLFVRNYNIRPRQCQTPHFSIETTISGPNNLRPHAFHARLQYQAPTMSDPTLFVRDNNIRPQQCHTPCFLCEITISGPKMSYPTFFVREYNIRPQQCHTPHVSFETTISGPDNVNGVLVGLHHCVRIA